MTVKDRMDDWDRNIAPLLNLIELKAIWCDTYANSMLELVDRLTSRPNFKTLAEDKIEKVITTTEAVLSKLKQTHQNFQNKEVV